MTVAALLIEISFKECEVYNSMFSNPGNRIDCLLFICCLDSYMNTCQRMINS